MSEFKEKIEQLEQFNFASEESFDIDKNFDFINGLEFERTQLKNLEAETFVKANGEIYLDKVILDNFFAKKENLISLIRRYSADKEVLKALTDEVGGGKDKLYKIANFLYNSFSLHLNEMKYKITFTYDEYDFIYKTLNRKIKYTSDEVFQYLRLFEEGLSQYDVVYKATKKGEDIVAELTIANIILLYHLINKYQVVGVNNEFRIFSTVLNKIGEANQVYNSIVIIRDRLNEQFQMWTTSITPIETKGETIPVENKSTLKIVPATPED
jgi:hypothetical protein